MSQNTCTAYTIEDIKSWQVDILSKSDGVAHVKLPTLQRGFVWSANQIELLWDSILRGYPIGAVLMAESDGLKELLDGQQRSTSIALGFFDPFEHPEGVAFLNASKNAPTIWIDLKPYDKNIYGAQFALRTLTRSHPWGYQRNDNRKPLSAVEKKRAFTQIHERLENKNSNLRYTDLPSGSRIPWDAFCPVPLAFLLNAERSSFENWKSDLMTRIHTQLQDLRTMHDKEDIPMNDKWELSDETLLIFFNAIKKAYKLIIPEVKVAKDVLDAAEGSDIEANAEATLFVRLNNGGTQISGEELIYSMLKASFPGTKELVEEIGRSFLTPSRIVNLFARLAFTDREDPRFQKEMSIQNFRRNLKNDSFQNALVGYIHSSDENKTTGKKLVDEAIRIIEGIQNELAPIYVKDLIKRSTDLFYVLLLYVELNPEEIRRNNLSNDHRAYHFAATMGIDQKEIAENLVDPILKEKKSFHESILLICRDHNLFRPVIEPKEFYRVLIEKLIPKCIEKSYHVNNEMVLNEILLTDRITDLLSTISNPDQKISAEFSIEQIHSARDRWTGLMNKLVHDRNLLIHAQRRYFIERFSDYMEFDGINDTNRPWDWDHIYPESWVYYRPDIDQSVRNSYNFNGNFRALSYDDNRSENNRMSPETRFFNEKDPIPDYNPSLSRSNSFVHDKDDLNGSIGFRCNDLQHWFEIDKRSNTLKKEDPKVNHLILAIFKRTVNIYAEWFDSFGFPYALKETTNSSSPDDLK